MAKYDTRALAELKLAQSLGSKTAAFNFSAASNEDVQSRLQAAVGGAPLTDGQLSKACVEWVKRAVQAHDYHSMALAVRESGSP